MFNKLKKRYAKRVFITLSELYKLAEQEGLDVKYQPKYKVNSTYHHILDNDTSVIYENWCFKITESYDENNPNKILKTFEYNVGIEKCKHCYGLENFRKFNEKYELCSKCFKTIKKDWNRKESTFKDFIDARIVLKKLNN